jgi:serine/threonine protein kinase
MGNCMGSDAAAKNSAGGKAPAGINPASPKNSFKQNYVLGEILGEGAFSVVKLATHKQTKSRVAVKIINKSGLSEVDELSLRQEVAILKDLKHPNIVGLVGTFCFHAFVAQL